MYKESPKSSTLTPAENLAGSRRCRQRRGRVHNSHALDSCCCKAAAVVVVVRKVVAAVNVVHSTHFPVPDIFSSRLTSYGAFREAKAFFSGLLDALNGAGSHPWLSLVIGLPVQDRLSLASTLTSGKQLLPDPCPGMVKMMTQAHRELMSKPFEFEDQLGDFIRFCKQRVDKMFPYGWDEGYTDCIEGSTLPLSAGVGLPRSKGGVASSGWTRDDFVSACSTGNLEFQFPSSVDFRVVVAKGKARGITITHKEHQVLKPLHAVLYNFLSKKEWLLRGDARPECFGDFLACRGEVFVSGDYESATDGLALEVSEAILDTLLSKCRYTPEGVRRWALASLRSNICYEDGEEVEQLRGQLMGNLLSFPLLCLYNFLAFKFHVKRRVPLRINGDDIVCRLTREEYESWKGGLKRLGLKLSSGKTFVHPRYFAVNSTYFWAYASKRPKLLPVARLGMLKKPDNLGGLGSSHRVFLRPFRGRQKIEASVLFLTNHRLSLKMTGRSLLTPLPMGMGIVCGVEALGRAGLFERESWYLREFSPRREFPKVPCPHNLKGIPEGWRKTQRWAPRVWKSVCRSILAQEMIEARWQTRIKMEEVRWCDYWYDVRSSGAEGLWRTFVQERRGGAYQRGLRLLRGAGYTRSHHPLKLSAAVVYRQVEKNRCCTRDDGWYVKERREEIAFVLSTQPRTGAVPEVD